MENTQLLIVRHRKKLIAALLLVFFVMAFGCNFYGGIKGTVLDNAAGKPIEGAVVVAQWVKERGFPGMRYHNLHKITESLTDKNGKFSLNGTIGILLEPPEMIICKEGYIPWRNDMVYPGGMPGYEKIMSGIIIELTALNYLTGLE
jgi:DNA-binding protein